MNEIDRLKIKLQAQKDENKDLKKMIVKMVLFLTGFQEQSIKLKLLKK